MNATPLTANVPTQQHIKSMHLKQIYLSALRSGGISRAHLKQELHLSFPSVSRLVDELLAHNVLVESNTRESPERGRPRTLLRVNPNALAIPVLVMTREGYRYAVYDCSATCLDEGFLSFDPGSVPPSSPTERWCPSVETLCTPLEDWSRRLARTYHVADLLLVVPGTANKAGGLSSSALQMSAPSTFLSRLQQLTGWNVIVQNNSDCLAYAEKTCGCLCDDFIYIYIGKGVGAGIIRSGRVFQNQGPRAGEIGHISIHYSGRPCTCGRKGCLEGYVSAVAMTQDARNMLTDLTLSTFEDVCRVYATGHGAITKLFQEKALLLAVGIHNMLSMQPVSHVILGGKAPLLGPDFLSSVQNCLQNQCRSHHVTISYAKTASDSEPMGALWNYLDHLMHMDCMLCK